MDGDGVEIEGEMGERVKKERRRRQAYAKPVSAHRSPRDARISTEQQPASDVTDTRAHKHTSDEAEDDKMTKNYNYFPSNCG